MPLTSLTSKQTMYNNKKNAPKGSAAKKGTAKKSAAARTAKGSPKKGTPEFLKRAAELKEAFEKNKSKRKSSKK